ncbi:unnamed protein product [Arctogadus glacialis]
MDTLRSSIGTSNRKTLWFPGPLKLADLGYIRKCDFPHLTFGPLTELQQWRYLVPDKQLAALIEACLQMEPYKTSSCSELLGQDYFTWDHFPDRFTKEMELMVKGDHECCVPPQTGTQPTSPPSDNSTRPSQAESVVELVTPFSQLQDGSQGMENLEEGQEERDEEPAEETELRKKKKKKRGFTATFSKSCQYRQTPLHLPRLPHARLRGTAHSNAEGCEVLELTWISLDCIVHSSLAVVDGSRVSLLLRCGLSAFATLDANQVHDLVSRAKSSSCKLDPMPTFLLADLGYIRKVLMNSIYVTDWAGTPVYMPPEVPDKQLAALIEACLQMEPYKRSSCSELLGQDYFTWDHFPDRFTKEMELMVKGDHECCVPPRTGTQPTSPPSDNSTRPSQAESVVELVTPFSQLQDGSQGMENLEEGQEERDEEPAEETELMKKKKKRGFTATFSKSCQYRQTPLHLPRLPHARLRGTAHSNAEGCVVACCHKDMLAKLKIGAESKSLYSIQMIGLFMQQAESVVELVTPFSQLQDGSQGMENLEEGQEERDEEPAEETELKKKKKKKRGFTATFRRAVNTLADLGYIRKVQVASVHLTSWAGTAVYMPPEVLLGETKYSTPVDVWAIGCTILAMAKPQNPCRDLTYRALVRDTVATVSTAVSLSGPVKVPASGTNSEPKEKYKVPDKQLAELIEQQAVNVVEVVTPAMTMPQDPSGDCCPMQREELVDGRPKYGLGRQVVVWPTWSLF